MRSLAAVLTADYLDYAYDQCFPEPIGCVWTLPRYENYLELGGWA